MLLSLSLSLLALVPHLAHTTSPKYTCTTSATRIKRSQPPTMAIVKKVTTKEFEQELQDCSTPIVLDVYAVWCGPCQLMAPQLEQVAAELGDSVRILKVDSDEEPEVADTLRIQGLPTLLFIQDTSVVMRAEGALMADELRKLIDYHFFDGPKPDIDGFQQQS